jgi:hypothetical protein
MKFDWSEYLNLAQELAGQPSSPASTEAKLRTAVSRAYYAAHCRVRNHVRDVEGLPIPQTGEVHQLLIDMFIRSPDRRRRKIRTTLKRLRIDRIKADYHDAVTGLPSMVVVALKLAQQSISTLSTL